MCDSASKICSTSIIQNSWEVYLEMWNMRQQAHRQAWLDCLSPAASHIEHLAFVIHSPQTQNSCHSECFLQSGQFFIVTAHLFIDIIMSYFPLEPQRCRTLGWLPTLCMTGSEVGSIPLSSIPGSCPQVGETSSVGR